MNTSFGSMDHRRAGRKFFSALTLEVLRSTPLPFLEFNSFQEFHSFLRRPIFLGKIDGDGLCLSAYSQHITVASLTYMNGTSCLFVR